ncbi:NADH dehydrogenase subunit 4L (mitochondrion) [Diorhabda carinulata]|uniref:NADH-ubiquinone oxidoreductase chain 4L n=2 Tax=Diorhabda TaxID=217246 RepID=A0A4Y5MZ45_9CUCU|nr:NADH dehydrogenase subunit 4L [Diorhabda carinata]YP_009663658.1 NADH dehydrogenase subunit 4L [Diorhabda carinulata]QCW06690.1 NADH dehydrogenase subunit 4L [Diorhabda carinata]QCW06703.1 NADH dehydrogenase subunit 4L [Diorhabda carinulata]
MLMYLLMVMFFSGGLMFVLNRKHLLMMLLSLEFIVISLYFSLFLYLSNMTYEYFFSMIYLTMSVCEGALGLSMLILMVRVHGNDYITTFSFLW